MAQTILGIDPGLNITGYSILTENSGVISLAEAGVFRSKRSPQMGRRLVQLFDGLQDAIRIFSPDSIAIEELYSHYQQPKTAIIMGHARGVFCLAAAQKNIPVFHYSATQIKKILTGNGRAPKEQVQLAVMRHFNLNEPPDPPDVADAIAIGLCHYYLSKSTATSI